MKFDDELASKDLHHFVALVVIDAIAGAPPMAAEEIAEHVERRKRWRAHIRRLRGE